MKIILDESIKGKRTRCAIEKRINFFMSFYPDLEKLKGKLVIECKSNKCGNVRAYTYPDDADNVFINLINVPFYFFSWKKFNEILFHELVHARQIFFCELQEDSKSIYWMGKCIISRKKLNSLYFGFKTKKDLEFYDNLPWEKDAIDTAKYMKKLFNKEG